jgi:hypothetical protein
VDLRLLIESDTLDPDRRLIIRSPSPKRRLASLNGRSVFALVSAARLWQERFQQGAERTSGDET